MVRSLWAKIILLKSNRSAVSVYKRQTALLIQALLLCASFLVSIFVVKSDPGQLSYLFENRLPLLSNNSFNIFYNNVVFSTLDSLECKFGENICWPLGFVGSVYHKSKNLCVLNKKKWRDKNTPHKANRRI